MIWNADKNESDYINPIIYTDYSDPDAIRVGSDFYMTASSFNNVPGLPVLHSKDLVHWNLISYAVNQLPDDSYNAVRHGCGVWAPAIRFHAGRFYICFPMPDEGIYMVTAEKPEGPWSEPVQLFAGKGYIDPCPLWDDDGKAYLVMGVAKSRIGFNSVLFVSEMAPDGSRLLSKPKKVYDGIPDGNTTCEGPKLYKRNGWYYIFAPAGGVKCGWQLAMRSRNIYGPYEVRKIMWQGSTGVNGPHQGAWIDTPSGDWFIHFQDVFAAGRIVHLQPLRWEDDWPVIGEPRLIWEKPVLKGEQAGECAVSSVPACSASYSLPWQWNANRNQSMAASTIALDHLQLYSAFNLEDRQICDYPNLLLRKWESPQFTVTGTFDLTHVDPGVRCGIISLGMEYGAVEIRTSEKGLQIWSCTGKIWDGEQTECIGELDSGTGEVGFSITVRPSNTVTAVSPKPEYTAGMEHDVLHPEEEVTLRFTASDGTVIACKQFAATAGRWVGAKYGFYCTKSTEDECTDHFLHVKISEII